MNLCRVCDSRADYRLWFRKFDRGEGKVTRLIISERYFCADHALLHEARRRGYEIQPLRPSVAAVPAYSEAREG